MLIVFRANWRSLSCVTQKFWRSAKKLETSKKKKHPTRIYTPYAMHLENARKLPFTWRKRRRSRTTLEKDNRKINMTNDLLNVCTTFAIFTKNLLNLENVLVESSMQLEEEILFRENLACKLRRRSNITREKWKSVE